MIFHFRLFEEIHIKGLHTQEFKGAIETSNDEHNNSRKIL